MKKLLIINVFLLILLSSVYALNDNKINGTVTHSTQTNQKHRVIPIKDKKIYHDNSVSLHKVKKKIKLDKKYPLTSRNERESIPYELIRKIIKKI